MAVFKMMQSTAIAVAYPTCRRYCTTEELYTLSNPKTPHPYLKMHPWASKKEFTEYLLKNIIYNADGIVAINKPYGIPITDPVLHNRNISQYQNFYKIAESVGYSINSILPHVAKELDVPVLIPCTGAEKYSSGTYVFATDIDVVKQIKKANARAVTFGKFKKYWGITIKQANEIKGSYHLAMKLKELSGLKKPVFVTKWSKNEEKKGAIKIMNIKYKLLSNSTQNLSSLIEIESSARKWYGIRLFASVMLYSPILGDNFHGSRVQKIMNTWVKVNPFAESCSNMPNIDKQLLELLKLRPHQQEIIPVHIHLRSLCLDAFGKEKKNLVLEAPLPDHFNWTCKQLMFKNVLCEDNCTSTEDKVKIS